MAAQRGRPRGFDIEAALDQAVEVFWKNGFQATSLQALTSAMGLNKPSLYAAFGDKETLYLRALERYAAHHVASHAAILAEEPDGYRAVEGFLRSLATMLTDASLPGGCFIVTGSADCGGAATPEKVDAALRAALQNSEAILRERLLLAQRDGQLTAQASVDVLATLFSSIVGGLAVQAKSGASQDRLYQVIEAVMTVWPRDTAG